MKSVAEHLAEASMDGANIVLSAADCNTSSIHVVSISFDTTIRAIGAAQEEARREALEEALRLAESHPEDCNHKRKPFCCDEYAKQLRTLIDKEPNEAP